MKKSSPNGPLIPESTNFSTNFSRILKVTDIIILDSFLSPNDILSNNTILSEGTLSNLNDPVTDTQAATYAYIQSQVDIGKSPGGPINSLQYNDSGAFNGSNTLTYNKISNTLEAKNISIYGININPIVIGSNTITGLDPPVSNQDAANKEYVNIYVKITDVNIVGSITYNAIDLINGIIYRDTQTTGKTIDTLPTAAQIINAANALTGTSIKFEIKNISTDYENVLSFAVGTGIIYGNEQNIYSGYSYEGIMMITNITPGSEEIILYTTNCSLTNTTKYANELGGMASIINTIRITDFQLIYNNPTQILLSDLTINTINIANKVNYIVPTSPLEISLSTPDSLIGVILNTSFISVPFIWKSGGIDFYIINNGVNAGANITLTSDTGTIPWVLDPNSNMIIPPRYTGWFMIYLTISNYPSITSLTSANIYTLGIFPNT